MKQVALITGSTGGGTGTETAFTLARQGFAIAIHGRDAARAQQVVNDLRKKGAEATSVVGDLAEPDTCRLLVEESAGKLGPITALIHNAAGGAPFLPLEQLEYSQWKADFSVILDAAFHLSAAVLPNMRARKTGRIIFVSSSAAWRGSFGRGASYAAAKAGLGGLARQMALDCGPDNITVNVVFPGQVDTPRVRQGGRRSDADFIERGRCTPLRRVGQPQDVAETIGFLCSPAAGYLTGVFLPIDGGSSLAGSETRIRSDGNRCPATLADRPPFPSAPHGERETKTDL